MASTWTPSTSGDEPAKKEEAATIASATRPEKRRKRVTLCVAILGLMCLSYLLGAAVISFQLPSSELLRKAFQGARAWNERRQLPASVPIENTPPPKLGSIDKADKTFDGFTLYSSVSMTERWSNTQAFLVNMRGDPVHRWATSFSKIWPSPPHLRNAVRDDFVCFFDCYLYPNGDLLVTFHGLENRANGYGLAKLDKDSNVVWKCSRNIHHDVEVAEDGTIYAIAHRIVQSMPQGLEDLPTPSLIDELITLSPDGKEIAEPISILEAFRDSSYAPLLGALVPENNRDLPSSLDRRKLLDPAADGLHEPLHMNCVRELPKRLATRFPNFKPGQLLISLRNMDTIAVLDPHKRLVVWAARGPWRAQHDAQFLDNGHLLIFDNLGSPRSSRVLEYDPQTQSFPWWYPQGGDPTFYTMERGMSQRLPNGNTLIVCSQQGKIWEVTHERETVWSLFPNRYVHVGRRYAPERLTFLPKGTYARP